MKKKFYNAADLLEIVIEGQSLFLNSRGFMKLLSATLFTLLLSGTALAATPTTEEPTTFQCIAAKITIGDKQVDSVVLWNTKTGEARLLNSASFADKTTGQKGNLIGWVPLLDLQRAVQNLQAQIQEQQQRAAANPEPSPDPSSGSTKKKK
jgi:hypothetical protein